MNEPDPAAARLDELADIAELCRTAFLASVDQTIWNPRAGSPAAQAKIWLAQQDPAANSELIMAGIDLVSEVVVTYIEIAADHLGGLAALYRAGEVIFSPLPIVRSIIEHSDRALWVLGDRPRRPYTDILARAYLEAFHSAEATKAAAGRLGSTQDANYNLAKSCWQEIRRRAIAAFPGTTADDLSESKPGRILAGQVFLGPEASTERAFEFLARSAAGSLTGVQARGVYGLLSSGTHPSLDLARQFRKAVHRDNHVEFNLRVDSTHLERLLAGALAMFYNALSYAIDFYGVDRSAHEQLTTTIDALMPSIFA